MSSDQKTPILTIGVYVWFFLAIDIMSFILFSWLTRLADES